MHMAFENRLYRIKGEGDSVIFERQNLPQQVKLKREFNREYDSF